MYSILIVDDEIHAVEGVQEAVNWERLKINNVFTAHNIRQAKEVFDNHSIDIMLCDIEMPQGSGLDLLAWVREFYPKTECIFLTCHADFSFAKQAMKLGSIDYILKPLPFMELEEVIQKATEKINKEKDLLRDSVYGQYWVKNQPLLIERFWQDILNGTIPSNLEAIKEAAAERHIQLDENQLILPILVSIQGWQITASPEEEKAKEQALKMAAEEIFGKMAQIVQLGRDHWIVNLSLDRSNEGDMKNLKQLCETFIDSCHRYFRCDLSCYIGRLSGPHEIVTVVNQLYDLDRNNVSATQKVYSIHDKIKVSTKSKLPDMSVWSVFLQESNYHKVITEASAVLETMAREGIDANQLSKFYHDFQQILYYALKQKGIQAHQIFHDQQSLKKSQKACRTVKDLIEWIAHSVMQVEEFSNRSNQSDSTLEKAIKYITVNIDKDISRDDIANEVYLNPDYLSRIFKKETGLSISEYLLQQRMKISQELLEKTEMSISAVATYVGYNNFSYFSKIFKKQFGTTPVEYREKIQNHRTS